MLAEWLEEGDGVSDSDAVAISDVEADRVGDALLLMHVDALAHGDEAALRDKAPVADCRGEGDTLKDLRDVAL